MTKLTTPLYRTFAHNWTGSVQNDFETDTREALGPLLDRTLWTTLAWPLLFPTLIEMSPFNEPDP